MIEPGAKIGILGSGQLGRMLALAARRMGFGVHVYSPEPESPAGVLADVEFAGEYADADRVREFARTVDVITFEFENVAAECASAAEEVTLVRPAGRVLHITQNRLREKSFLKAAGIPVTPFVEVSSVGALAEATYPAVLKTAGFGYDGKGQTKVFTAADAEKAWDQMGRAPAILESFVAFRREVSVVAARSEKGQFVHYDVIENTHHNHILDVSMAPAGGAREALEIARAVLEKLEVVGLATVEFFEDQRGTLMVNEIAPRVHNSGHLTIEACMTSQFEQQLRAVCGLPLGSTAYRSPAAMANLLGDEWDHGQPNWAAALETGAVLHLYGKKDARRGRKMGHLTSLGTTPADAARQVKAARDRLRVR